MIFLLKVWVKNMGVHYTWEHIILSKIWYSAHKRNEILPLATTWKYLECNDAK